MLDAACAVRCGCALLGAANGECGRSARPKEAAAETEGEAEAAVLTTDAETEEAEAEAEACLVARCFEGVCFCVLCFGGCTLDAAEEAEAEAEAEAEVEAEAEGAEVEAVDRLKR